MKGCSKKNGKLLKGMTNNQKNCLAIEMAYFIIDNKTTIRKTAKRFKVSKTTVHVYIHNRVSKLDIILYEQVLEIFKINSNEKHIRGGETTRLLKLGAKKKK